MFGYKTQKWSVLIVDSRESERRLKELFLRQVLPHGVDYAIKDTLSEAAEFFTNNVWDIVLLVVDNDVRTDVNSSARGRGTAFVNREIVDARGMAPPTIITYREYDTVAPMIRGSHKGFRICPMKDTDFTRRGLQSKLEEWGIMSSRNLSPESSGISGDLLDKIARGELRTAFTSVLEADSDERRWDSVWDIADQLDCALRRRRWGKYYEPSKSEANLTYQWLKKTPLVSEEQKKGRDFERYTRLLLLEAELLWSTQPVIALYLLIEIIDLRLTAKREPLGQHQGEMIYSVARRINAKMLAKWFAASHDSFEIVSRFDSSLWHILLRDVVRRALANIKKNTNALIDLEKNMRLLQASFEERGNTLGALEIEARVCEIRKHRLHGWQWALSAILELGCDYGNQPLRLVKWCLFAVGVFALIYQPQPSCFPAGLPSIQIELPADKAAAFQFGTGWLRHFPMSLYFSLESFFNLGYGDFSGLNTLGRAVVCCEGLLGLGAFGLLIAVAATKLRPR